MLTAVFSDIHSNREALEAVLARARAEGATRMLVLGDIVGYGADPGAVVQTLRALPEGVLIAGNHDLAACGRFDPMWFNGMARDAIHWTAEVLDDQDRAFLASLEARSEPGSEILVHGSVVDPVGEYVLRDEEAAASFDAEPFTRCFFGHTHVPSIFMRDERGAVTSAHLANGVSVEMTPGVRVMLNPGSVGQPRDGDPRASFMIVDDEAHVATVLRVEYDVAVAAGKIIDAGLPHFLADRLSAGR